MKMVEGKAAEQEVDYEFFKAGVDGRKEGEVGTDKRFGEIQLFLITSNIFFSATIGGILWACGVGYMARQFKNRPKDMKISVYLIHTRMYAQMTVVGLSFSAHI